MATTNFTEQHDALLSHLRTSVLEFLSSVTEPIKFGYEDLLEVGGDTVIEFGQMECITDGVTTIEPCFYLEYDLGGQWYGASRIETHELCLLADTISQILSEKNEKGDI